MGMMLHMAAKRFIGQHVTFVDQSARETYPVILEGNIGEMKRNIVTRESHVFLDGAIIVQIISNNNSQRPVFQDTTNISHLLRSLI